ncbi:MAG: hydrogenase, partial [Thermus sp.]
MDKDLIKGEFTEKGLIEELLKPVEKPPPGPWWVVLAVGAALTLAWLYAIFVTFVRGLGTWGINQPVAWGYDIVHFVWWIGIGHAGTLISAILVLMRQNWRDSLNRLTEAMTLFAVLCA